MLDRYFQFRQHGTTLWREVFAGLTTFLTMSYILVVQPSVLSTDFAGQPTGLEAGAVLLATSLSSALACGLMGLYARLPIALAPGMGQNFFFLSVVMALGSTSTAAEPWQGALGITFVAGLVFLLLTLLGIRQLVLDVISPSLRAAIAVGIGFFIAFIGLKNAGIVTAAPSLVTFNADNITRADSCVFWLGLLATLIFVMRRVPGGILWGMMISAVAAWTAGKISIEQWFGWPTFSEPAAFSLDLRAAFSGSGASFVCVFLFMDLFDTTGTLIGVGQQAGLMDQDGKLPRMKQAMLADAVGSVAGACLGTSTVTSYIESAAGVQAGGRTGLTAITVGLLFLMSLAFSPIMIAIGSYAPITAPAMVVVGSMMFRSVRDIDWSDETESVPSFLIILGIPLFFSIADGIAIGLIIWTALKAARGRHKEVTWAGYGISTLLLLYLVFIRTTV